MPRIKSVTSDLVIDGIKTKSKVVKFRALDAEKNIDKTWSAGLQQFHDFHDSSDCKFRVPYQTISFLQTALEHSVKSYLQDGKNNAAKVIVVELTGVYGETYEAKFTLTKVF